MPCRSRLRRAQSRDGHSTPQARCRDKGEHYDAETIRYFSEPELQLLFSALQASCNVRLKLLVVLLYRTGCRVSEVLGLDRADHRPEDALLYRLLGKVIRSVFATTPTWKRMQTDWAISLLARISGVLSRGPTSRVVDWRRTQYGGGWGACPMHRRSLTGGSWWMRCPQLKGSRLHDLRHTFGTERVGIMPIEELRALMGHSNVATTLRYAKVTPQRAAGSARQAISQVSRF